ncbi:MAG: amino acid permease, partial [Mycolicibacterium vanbaalenii]
IAWPRVAFEQRYLDWSVWIGVVVLGMIGAVLFATVKSRIAAPQDQDDRALVDD